VTTGVYKLFSILQLSQHQNYFKSIKSYQGTENKNTIQPDDFKDFSVIFLEFANFLHGWQLE